MVHETSKGNRRFRASSSSSLILNKALNLQDGEDINSAIVNIQDELILRKAEEAASRRFQATGWLRQMDHGAWELLPEDPSKEEFCLALRSGLILCNVLNRVNPGAIPKVVESPITSVQLTDGAAQSAIQYFENMRNFLVAVGEMKLLTFEASDLEKGGSSYKVVDCILCLKGYHEWKLAGGVGIWRYGGIVKITSMFRELNYSSLCGESGDELPNDSNSRNQQLSEVLNLFSKIFIEESNVAGGLNCLFDKLGFHLLNAYLTEWSGSEELTLTKRLSENPPMKQRNKLIEYAGKVIDMVLEKVVSEFHELLICKQNQMGLLLKSTMKDESKSLSKEGFSKAISKYLDEKNCGISNACSASCTCGGRCGDKWVRDIPVTGNQERLDSQQKQIEELRSTYHEMRSQVQCNQAKWDDEIKKLEHYMQGLEQAANSYYKLLEENRLLYNQVQDLKGTIRVYCRVRPFLPGQCSGKSTVDFIGENGNIVISNPTKQGKEARKIFSFDKVFGPNVTQQQVFADTQPLIRSVLDGYNVCIFAYGQTGSGKTYTMSGPNLILEETWGVSYRALNDLFQISNARTDTIMYDINVQMIEIYNEQVRDLLVVQGSNRRLDIRNNSQLNGLNVPDASLVPVNCTQDVLDLMKIGQGNRAVGATALNERSSRSHSVLTVHVQGKELLSGSILRGCLHLVDLAGSERVDKSEAVGERLKEAQHINRSLSALGDVIYALAQKNAHIPYRNSKLTQVLQDALGGQAKTLMFVHINPEVNAIGETISTLKFAERVSSIELGAARANKEAAEIRELKEEISKLKLALESKESEVEQLKNSSSSRTSVQLQKPRAASPLNSQRFGINSNLKSEASWKVIGDARSIELRSCSSGKSSKSRLRAGFHDKELEHKSPSTVESYLNFKKIRSSPVRRSLSADRGLISKERPKLAKLDGATLRLPGKASINQSVSMISKIQMNESLDGCWALLDNPNSRNDHREFEKHRLKVAPISWQLGFRKNRMECKMISKNQLPLSGSENFDMNNGEDMEEIQGKSGFSEEEIENRLGEQSPNCSPKTKKLHQNITRSSQNIRPRNLTQAMEPLSTGKHES